ncbi:MAG TPA: hypothetical protein PLI06_08000 [Methanofastidiosum sp.]|nr:hypothetical protein [Methanofastidiosum sp.]
MEFRDIFRYVLLLVCVVYGIRAYMTGQLTLRYLLIAVVLCAVTYFIIARPDKY